AGAATSPRSRTWSAYGARSTGVCAPVPAGRAAVGGPNPVAITVIFTLPFSAGSTTAPKMMFASSSAACCTIDAASLTSTSERSCPPVTLMMTARAPVTAAPSSSGLEMARRAASIARSCPSATPVPIIASPMPAMIVFTSAKSRLIKPGTRIRSEIPCIAWRSTGARAAAKSGRDEDHVGAVERLDDLVRVLQRRLPSDVRVGAGAESLRQLAADLQLDRRGTGPERLQIGVGDDELDAVETDLHHAVDGVAAAAADADDFDAGSGGSLFVETQSQALGLFRLFVHRQHSLKRAMRPAPK